MTEDQKIAIITYLQMLYNFEDRGSAVHQVVEVFDVAPDKALEVVKICLIHKLIKIKSAFDKKHIAIYNRPLSPDEVTKNYNECKGRFENKCNHLPTDDIPLQF